MTTDVLIIFLYNITPDVFFPSHLMTLCSLQRLSVMESMAASLCQRTSFKFEFGCCLCGACIFSLCMVSSRFSSFLLRPKDMQVRWLVGSCSLPLLHKWVVESGKSWWDCGLNRKMDWWLISVNRWLMVGANFMIYLSVTISCTMPTLAFSFAFLTNVVILHWF